MSWSTLLSFRYSSKEAKGRRSWFSVPSPARAVVPFLSVRRFGGGRGEEPRLCVSGVYRVG